MPDTLPAPAWPAPAARPGSWRGGACFSRGPKWAAPATAEASASLASATLVAGAGPDSRSRMSAGSVSPRDSASPSSVARSAGGSRTLTALLPFPAMIDSARGDSTLSPNGEGDSTLPDAKRRAQFSPTDRAGPLRSQGFAVWLARLGDAGGADSGLVVVSALRRVRPGPSPKAARGSRQLQPGGQRRDAPGAFVHL